MVNVNTITLKGDTLDPRCYTFKGSDGAPLPLEGLKFVASIQNMFNEEVARYEAGINNELRVARNVLILSIDKITFPPDVYYLSIAVESGTEKHTFEYSKLEVLKQKV